MAATFELGGQERVDDLVGQSDTDDAGAHRQDVGIVVLARQTRGVEAVAQRGAYATHLVRGELFALSASAEHDADLGCTVAHRPADAGADLGIVDRLGRVGAVIVDVVPGVAQPIHDVLFEFEPGMVGADRDPCHRRRSVGGGRYVACFTGGFAVRIAASLTSSAVTLDPRTPVIVGVGQYLERDSTLENALEPVALMERAVIAAASDAGLDGPPQADSIRVVNVIGWRYRNAPRFVAERLGIRDAELVNSTSGGNTPQSFVNRTSLDILEGGLDIAIITGGEAFRTYLAAKRDGATLYWAKAADDDHPVSFGKDTPMSHPAELELGIGAPVQLYPMFETALRASMGNTPAEHRERLGRLWSGLSHVAADNPHAWIRQAMTPDEITDVSPSNRMIGLPYPKLMNSNNNVDMAAAIIMCSVEAARRLGVSEDRWVFPVAGSDCHEHPYVSHRRSFDHTPAIELGGHRVLELAGLAIDDVSIIDLYSCFPSAVQLGARALGIDPLERQWSRTGGLTFAGGPWNNYVSHAIATVVADLREQPDEHALVWGNGGYATRHAFGVYATTPPVDGFVHDDPQAEIDAMPRRELALPADASGRASIESYTVMFDREGAPERAITSCLLADGRRAWGTSDDQDTALALTEGEWVGADVTLTASGTLAPA
jgi:acetyl-CoA C-acetyltransferase